MSMGTTLRVGFALLGVTMSGACAQRELDKKPELAQEHGYYVPFGESKERGGVGGYVDVPSNSERARLNDTSNQAGVAPVPQVQATAPEAEATAPEPEVTAQSETIVAPTIASLEGQPQTILFDLGDATIKDESMSVLDQIAMELKDAGDVKVKVDGYADKLGSEELNQKLSEERAESVRDYLASKGAPSESLETEFFGEDEAINPKGSPQDRKVIISLG